MQELTADERLASTQQKLDKTWGNLKIDIARYFEGTNTDDEMQSVLRSHLYIEHEITGLLETYLKEPEVILGRNFFFMNKINLATALGLIEKDERIIFLKINNLRNKFAHNLHFNLSEDDYSNLYDSFKDDFKKMRDELSIINDASLVERTKYLLSVAWAFSKNKNDLLKLNRELESLKEEQRQVALIIYEKRRYLEELQKKVITD